MKKLSPILVALMLAACGGDGDYKPQGSDPVVPAPPAPPPPPPAPPADAFLSQVEKASAGMPDEAEPENVDAVTSTQPDDAEPKAL